MRRRALGLAPLLGLSCAPHHPAPVAPSQPTRDVYVLLLILDGGRADTVYPAVDAGELPNFKRYIFDRGVRVKDAMAVFPSVTTSGHQAFITGLFPGHSGIPGLDWFDRASGRVTDYLAFDVIGIDEDLLDKTRPITADDIFSKPQNLLDDLAGSSRATIYEPFNMGITDRGPKVPIAPLLHYFVDDYRALDVDTATRLKGIYARPREKIPRYLMATFLGHDVCEHAFGPSSRELLDEMRYEDGELGKVVEEMQAAGIWDRTYIVLAADHGQHPTGSYLSIPKLLRDAGLRPRGFYSAKVNTYSSLIAITSANIYLNKKGDWRDPLSLADLRSFPAHDGHRVDLIDTLTRSPAIEFALVPEPPDRVHIFAGGGRHGVVTRRTFEGTDYFSYAAGSAGDPLHYLDHPGVAEWVNDGRYHAGDAWALSTRDSLYPDAPVMLTQLFDGDRAGDIVVTAAPGWHFRHSQYVSSHGGIGREDMRVPLVLSGPDLPQGSSIPFARTADVYPTMKRIFGLAVSTARMDGRPLDEILSWVPEVARMPARNRANPTAEAYFSTLARLEALRAPADGLAFAPQDPEHLFRELKGSDTEAFGGQLDREVAQEEVLRDEVQAFRVRLSGEVEQLDRTVEQEGHEEYNDGLVSERKTLKVDREHDFILGRTLERLDARIARGKRLRQMLDLVKASRNVDELESLAGQSAAGTGSPD